MKKEGVGRRVLVVDDEPEILDLVQMMLEWEGYTVLEASDGWTGIEQARTEQPDLILLDVRMPKMTGLSVLDLLANDPRTADIPVIMLSVVTTHPEVRRALEHGATAYLSKPFEMNEMVHMVERVLDSNPVERQKLREQALELVGKP
jgi:CheY-like chemotaxis protein